MEIVATLMRVDMGRRADDFTSEIIDAAIVLKHTAGTHAAEQLLADNYIDENIIQRVLFGPPGRVRTSDLPAHVRMEQVRHCRVN